MQVKKKWADDMAAVLQRTAEGLLNTREDWLTNLITQQIIEGATKIMLVGIAKTVGTAGTGTAISTLSGAASKSAVFAWFGIGSASLGSFVVLPVLTTGGSWLCGRLLYGAERTRKELNKKEKGGGYATMRHCFYHTGEKNDKSENEREKLVFGYS